jgi:alkanesulfonate monooxygenase SsuD/methylene tetrahydromethanopterin reductase-like flavin-dependent oxidoreductase (luciferase family)
VIELCDGWLPICRGGALPPAIESKVPDLRRRAAAAGRDPASINVSVYFCPAEDDALATLARIGADRAVFQLPSAEPAAVLQRIDELALLAARAG